MTMEPNNFLTASEVLADITERLDPALWKMEGEVENNKKDDVAWRDFIAEGTRYTIIVLETCPEV